MKLEMDEKQLRESVAHGEWTSSAGGKREINRYAQYAKATFKPVQLNASQSQHFSQLWFYNSPGTEFFQGKPFQ